MALRIREGHHHRSNQEEVQESMKTLSWSRSQGSIDISAFPPRSCLCFRLSGFSSSVVTALEKRVDGGQRRSKRERRGWRKQISRHGHLTSDAIK